MTSLISNLKIYCLIILAYLFLIISHSFGFTLNTSTSAAFTSKEVKFYLTSNSLCENIGISPEELIDLAKEAANDFWNRVPTSSVRLKNGGILNTTNSLYLSGKLCAREDNQNCDDASSVPFGNDIIIACNNNTENFSATNILALSGPTNISGSKISGSVLLLNNISNSDFSLLTSHEKKAALAHEFGHALGLGHSKKEEALMYYRNADRIHRLSQDDIDGISYLYPNKLDGCGSFFSSVKFLDSNQGGPGHLSNDKSSFSFIMSSIFGTVFIIIISIFSKFICSFLLRIRHYLIN